MVFKKDIFKQSTHNEIWNDSAALSCGYKLLKLYLLYEQFLLYGGTFKQAT